jgi:hypothetical protein
MALITLEEAARLVGLTTDQMKISRQRGLSPGSLGNVIGGRLMFEERDLLPPPARPSSSERLSMANSKPELIAAARALGLEIPSSTTKAELLELIEAHG